MTTWRLFPVVEALQAPRGLNLTEAVTLIAEVGDLTRFDAPRKLMSYLGLTPSEYSSKAHRHQGGITKAGNGHARRALLERVYEATTLAATDTSKVVTNPRISA